MTEQPESDPDLSEAESEESVNTINTSDLDSDDKETVDAKPRCSKRRHSDTTEDSSVLAETTSDLKKELPKTEEPNRTTQEPELEDESGKLPEESGKLPDESEKLPDGSGEVLEESGEVLEESGESEEMEDQGVDKDVMNMFASVWVKVEVEADDESVPQDDLTDVNYEPPREKRAKRGRPRGEKKDRTRPTKILNCQLCDYTTVYKTGLIVHMIGHTSEKPYSCSECGYKSKYRNALTRHVKIQHQKDDAPPTDCAKTFSCDQCDYQTHFTWNLRAHKRKHNLDKQFKCDHCDYATAYRHNYLKHSRTHDNKDKSPSFYKCDKCTFVTKFEGHIARHLAKIHNEVTDTAYKCEMCDFSTRVRWRLNIHRSRSRQNNVLLCGYCNFQTYFVCESKKHKVLHYDVMYGHKAGTIEPFKNNVVEPHNSQIDAATGLPSSVNTKNESLPHDEYMENFMDVNNSDKSQKKYVVDPNCIDWNNIQVLESDDKDRPFQCHMCSYTSRFKASVQRHFQRHHTGSQNRPYKCMNCDFSTKTKDQIALHNKRSKSEVTLYCPICKYTTNFKCQYVMHQKRHYENKCSECEYSCKHKYELQKHYMTIHLGNGHKCQYCNYVAARKESLLCHETIHTGVKPFKCNHCEYMSVRRSLLNNHLRRYHSNVLDEMVVVSDSKIESLKHSGSIEEVNQNGLEFRN